MATDNVLEIKNLHTYFYTDGGVIKAVDGVDVELYCPFLLFILKGCLYPPIRGKYPIWHNISSAYHFLKQKRERPAGSPTPVGFASFYRTITELRVYVILNVLLHKLLPLLF